MSKKRQLQELRRIRDVLVKYDKPLGGNNNEIQRAKRLEKKRRK